MSKMLTARGTLTLSILKIMRSSITPIILYSLRSVATPGNPKYYSRKSRSHRRPHHLIGKESPFIAQWNSSITALPPNHDMYNTYEGVLSELQGLTTMLLCIKSSSALWLLWRADSGKVST